eukprot:7961708-Lingulodinium_polyedra.AAC.1
MGQLPACREIGSVSLVTSTRLGSLTLRCGVAATSAGAVAAAGAVPAWAGEGLGLSRKTLGSCW